MLHLVKKDILLCRMGIVIMFLINFLLGSMGFLITSILSSGETISTVMLGYVLFMGFYLTLSMVMEREQKVDGDMILHSIPLDKKVIVTSRYISSLLFPTAHGLIILIYSYILKYIHRFRLLGFRIEGEIQGMSIYSLLTVLSIMIVFLSFYLLLYYSKLGKGKASNILAYFVIIILPAIVFRFKDNILDLDFVKYISLLDKKILAIVGFLVSLVLYIASMEISKKLYSRW